MAQVLVILRHELLGLFHEANCSSLGGFVDGLGLISRLQGEPELGCGPKGLPYQPRHLWRYGAASVDDVRNGGLRIPDSGGEAVLGDAQRLEKFLLEDFPW